MDKQIAWSNGSGSIAVTYPGYGNASIKVMSDENDLFTSRSKTITVSGGNISRQVTITQNAAQYRLIEWVENTQSNTLTFSGIVPNDDNWEFYGKFQPVSFIGSYETIIAAYKNENSNCYRIIRNGTSNTNILVNANTKAGGGTTGVADAITIGTPFTFNLKKGQFTINNKVVTLGTTQGDTLTSALYINRGRWYGLIAYHNNIAVKCYHPCVDSTGKYGFVDILTDTIIYPTKGTFDSGGNYITRNFICADGTRIVTRDGYFFNVANS